MKCNLKEVIFLVTTIEKSINHKLGAFYTPDILSSYVSKRLIEFFLNDEDNNKDIANISVLDPACGDGALLKAFENEINWRLNSTEYNDECFVNNKKVTNVFGIDINPIACKEAEENVSAVIRNGRTQTYMIEDSISLMNKSWKKNDILPNRVKEFILNKDAIDCIITNPPWGATLNLSAQELRGSGYELAFGQYDSYEIMIELSLKLLKQNGYMALILPDSIFLQQHKPFREFLLKNTTIKLIYKLGEGFFNGVFRSTVLLIVKKSTFFQENEVICLSLNKEQRKNVLKNRDTLFNIELQASHLVPQSRFLQDKDYRLDIDVSNSEIELNLIEKIEKHQVCWGYFESGRGIEIAKSGEVQICSKCSSVFPKSKNENVSCKSCSTGESLLSNKIIDKTYHTNWETVLAGEDVNRYSINNSRYINTMLAKFNYKQTMLKSKKPKLLIRKTGLGISASIDYDNRFTLQTVFHFIKKEEAPEYLNVEYVLGVLNSRTLLYYHLKKTGEMEWKSHPYVTQTLIKELPIPLIEQSDVEGIKLANEISNKVKEILSIKPSDNKFIHLDLEIETLVTQLYGINKDEFKIIQDTISSAEQLRSISALKVPDGYEINVFV